MKGDLVPNTFVLRTRVGGFWAPGLYIRTVRQFVFRYDMFDIKGDLKGIIQSHK